MTQSNVKHARAWYSLLASGMLALMLALALAPSMASAHAELAGSDPAEGATVQAGLTKITLHFSEEISLDQTTAQLLSDSGTAVAGATSAVDKADRTLVTVTTPALQPGKYQAKWHAVTVDDNGITDGVLRFSVTGAQESSSGTSTTTTQASLPGTGAAQWPFVVPSIGFGAALLLVAGIVLRRRIRA